MYCVPVLPQPDDKLFKDSNRYFGINLQVFNMWVSLYQLISSYAKFSAFGTATEHQMRQLGLSARRYLHTVLVCSGTNHNISSDAVSSWPRDSGPALSLELHLLCHIGLPPLSFASSCYVL